jgi:c-di-GMP-binding flagellar brake protein YcgR
MAHCTMGEILDLSAGGMRVHSRVKVEKGHDMTITIITQHGPVSVDCKVAWVKRVKFFWYQIGLEFGAIDPELRRSLSEFARVAAETEVLRPSVAEFIADSKRNDPDRMTG